VERELLAQYRLAAARDSDDERDGIAQDASKEDLIKARVAARKPFDQRIASARRTGRARALLPRRSRTVDTSFRDSSGLGRKAIAPACIA
jgi:hypothetical protein